MDRVTPNNTYQIPRPARREAPPAAPERQTPAAEAQQRRKAAPPEIKRAEPLPRLGQNIDIRA